MIEALTLDEARGYTFGAGVVLLAAALLGVLLIRRLLVKAVVVLLAVGAAVVFLVERQRITIDPATCTASMFGIHVAVPDYKCVKAGS